MNKGWVEAAERSSKAEQYYYKYFVFLDTVLLSGCSICCEFKWTFMLQTAVLAVTMFGSR